MMLGCFVDRPICVGEMVSRSDRVREKASAAAHKAPAPIAGRHSQAESATPAEPQAERAVREIKSGLLGCSNESARRVKVAGILRCAKNDRGRYTAPHYQFVHRRMGMGSTEKARRNEYSIVQPSLFNRGRPGPMPIWRSRRERELSLNQESTAQSWDWTR
jgi:hypothetical protein